MRENRSKPVVNAEWDATLDVDGYEDSSISKVVLLPSKWKKDVAMSWRMDVDADVDESEESLHQMISQAWEQMKVLQ